MYKIIIIVTQTESLFTETRLSKLNTHIMCIGRIHIASDNCELNHIESSCALSQSIKVNQKSFNKKSVGMTLAKVKKQDGMTLAKVRHAQVSHAQPHTEVPSIPTSAACHNKLDACTRRVPASFGN